MRPIPPFFLLSTLYTFNHASPTVSIAAGAIQGSSCPSVAANYFLGIPFAQPPVGDLRFAPPQPTTAKFPSGTHNATIPAPACIQFGTQFLETESASEDCLYLDIWAPSKATTGTGLPVKVWIYGGGEQSGGISDPLYDGCNIASRDSILVSINYRLGALGFLALENAGIGGNFGIQDILLGLEWIQSNIASFGGDPSKVMLFGQSAGATNVFIVSTLPQAKTLVSSVISESGAGRDLDYAAGVNLIGEDFAKAVNCGTSDIACLRSVSTVALNASSPQIPGITIYSRLNPGNFQPYVDGTTIPSQPSAVGTKVPTIYGSNSNEGAIFVLGQYQSVNLTEKDYTSFLEDSFGPSASLVAQNYPLTAFNASPFPVFTAMSTIITDASYFCPAKHALDLANQNGIIAFTYYYDHTSNCAWLNSLPAEANPIVGATHTSEIPFVFGNLNTAMTLVNSTCNGTTQEYVISESLIDAWTAMALSGDPSIAGLEWPAWNGSSSLGVVVDNETFVAEVDYSACEFWNALDTQLLNFTVAKPNSTVSTIGATPTPTPTPTAPLTATGVRTILRDNSLGLFMVLCILVVLL